MTIQCDVLIVTAPYTETNSPLQAPAVIKAAVMNKGYTASTYDINNDFLMMEQSDPVKFNALKDFFSFGTTNDKSKIPEIQLYVKDVCEKLLQKFSPKRIAVSVFTYQCQQFSEMFAKTIRQMDPNIKLIFGGQGIMTQGMNATDKWVKNLQQRNIIDFYIVSEGENAIIDLLQEGKGHGINNTDWKQELVLERSPMPDYSDYDLDSYGGDRLLITGSRGCVRKCSFCDIHKHWKKFVFRSGQSIAHEMIKQSEKYKKYRFGFTDSLINGSMKAYRDFITIMAKHNRTARNRITWEGQFIVRGLRSMTEKDWTLTRESGARTLLLGVESGSEAVRDHMKKQFSNQDLDEFVEQAYINRVKLEFMMIVGYPTETLKDWQDTIDMFDRYKKYKSVIHTIGLGSTLSVLAGTPLAEENPELRLNESENFWTHEGNKDLTFRERIRRRILAGELLQDMGYTVDNNMKQIQTLHFLWGVYKNNQKQGVMADITTGQVKDQKYS